MVMPHPARRPLTIAHSSDGIPGAAMDEAGAHRLVCLLEMADADRTPAG